MREQVICPFEIWREGIVTTTKHLVWCGLREFQRFSQWTGEG
jgi:hypothetical protein